MPLTLSSFSTFMLYNIKSSLFAFYIQLLGDLKVVLQVHFKVFFICFAIEVVLQLVKYLEHSIKKKNHMFLIRVLDILEYFLFHFFVCVYSCVQLLYKHHFSLVRECSRGLQFFPWELKKTALTTALVIHLSANRSVGAQHLEVLVLFESDNAVFQRESSKEGAYE